MTKVLDRIGEGMVALVRRFDRRVEKFIAAVLWRKADKQQEKY